MWSVVYTCIVVLLFAVVYSSVLVCCCLMYEGGVVFGLISVRLLRLRYCLLLFYLQFCVRLFPLFIRSLRKLDGNRVQLVILVAVRYRSSLGGATGTSNRTRFECLH